MVAISFSVFKDKLLDGTKTQTIRWLDLPRIEQMQRLGIQIYWKQRTKNSEKLFDAKLKSIRVIQFSSNGYPKYIADVPDYSAPMPIQGYKTRPLSMSEQDVFARKDGFSNANEMAQWFLDRYGNALTVGWSGLPVYFMVVEWERV